MNSMMKRITRSGTLLAACTIYLAIQPFQASGANPNTVGTVTAWGYNGYGQLGNGTTTSSSKPVSVAFPPGVTASAIVAGAFHSLAITNDGLYAWGVGGAVGDGTTTTRTTPVKVAFPPAVTTVTIVSANGYHSLAITNDGLYTWGDNSSGQLGDGTTINRTAPVKVVFPPAVTTVSAIAAGFYHSLAITNDGLYAWGSNGGAQLGDGTRTNRTAPVKVAFPPAVTKLLVISGGGYHSLAITDDGPYAWGNNTFGQLGDGTTTDRVEPAKVIFQRATPAVTAIAAGFWHSLAIGDNSVYGWGYNGNGELGAISGATTTVPVKAIFPKTVTTVTAIAAGSMHSLAITNDGLYAWGNNSNGQLGMVGADKLTPANVKSESHVIAIGAGYYHSVALH